MAPFNLLTYWHAKQDPPYFSFQRNGTAPFGFRSPYRDSLTWMAPLQCQPSSQGQHRSTPNLPTTTTLARLNSKAMTLGSCGSESSCARHDHAAVSSKQALMQRFIRNIVALAWLISRPLVNTERDVRCLWGRMTSCAAIVNRTAAYQAAPQRATFARPQRLS